MKLLPLVLMVGLATLAVSCKKPASETKLDVAETAPAVTITTTASEHTVAPVTEASTKTAFDMTKVHVSTVILGAFPYLALPTGYVPGEAATLDVARFPFWIGDALHWVEGKVYMSQIRPASDKTWSKYEVQRNLEALITQAGGQKVSETTIPDDVTDKLADDDKQALNVGLGDIYNAASAVYLIHQANRDIWIHFNGNSAGGNWAIVEAKPFVPSAKLLPGTPAS